MLIVCACFKVTDKHKAELVEADKMKIVEHLSQNHDKYYGRLTGDMNLAKQKQYWDRLAVEYSDFNINSGSHLKEVVRVWIKRANERFDKVTATGSSGDDHLSEFQKSCRQLLRQCKGNEYMDGIRSVQSSGTNKFMTSTPKGKSKNTFEATTTTTTTTITTTTATSKTTATTTTATATAPSDSVNLSQHMDVSSVESNTHSPNCSEILNIPKPSKSKSTSDENISKNKILQTYCDKKEKDSDVKRQQLEVDKSRLDLEREKWQYEKKANKYKGMYYYLKCRELFRSPNISVKEIRDAHEEFQVPMSVDFEEVALQPDDNSFNESEVSTSDRQQYSDYNPNNSPIY